MGLEIEYDPSCKSYYEDLLGEYGVEYLLLGQHIYIGKESRPINVYFFEQNGDTAPYIDYANSLKDGMETGLFSAVAHPDLMFINKLPFDENGETACRIIVEAAKETGTILELNANGIRRGKADYPEGVRYPYPFIPFWQMVAQHKLPVIINSDCHEVRKLWDDCMESAYHLADKLALNIVDHL